MTELSDQERIDRLDRIADAAERLAADAAIFNGLVPIPALLQFIEDVELAGERAGTEAYQARRAMEAST